MYTLKVHRLRPTCDKTGEWKPVLYFNSFVEGGPPLQGEGKALESKGRQQGKAEGKRDCAAELRQGLASSGGW